MHEQESQARPARRRRPTPAIDQPLERGDVLALQQQVGNKGVVSLLSQRRARTVQRFEGPEHREIGNVTGMHIDLGNGVVLDWGQVVAIAGDEVGTEDELREWVKTDTGKQKIRAALESAEVPGGGADMLPAPTADQKSEQKARYYLLALDNPSHFPQGGEALGAWRKSHARALETAMRLGLANPKASTNEIQDAYLSEAWGQHFLTDMFSGGHIRTPRRALVDWYTTDFAPRVMDNFIVNVRYRLEDEIYEQVAAQSTKARVFEGTARDKIRAALNKMIDENVGKLKGGKQELTDYFGKVVAGIISGSMHDAEGSRGVVVSSVAHPEPWTALGDGGLDDPKGKLDEATRGVNKEQAQAAVMASLHQVDRAYEIGQREAVLKEALPEPDALPSKVYFPFASSEVVPEGKKAVEQAAAFMHYNADTRVDLIGHTDPIGSEEDNVTLGQQRADAVQKAITDLGVSAAQVGASSMGEKALVSANPRRYNLDRRVEFGWGNQEAPPSTAPGVCEDPAEMAYKKGLEALQAELGPPYQSVEDLIPEPVESANPNLPDWHWESLSPSLKQDVNNWVARRFTKDMKATMLGADALKPRDVEGFTVDPGPIVAGMIDEIAKNPVDFLNGLFQLPPRKDLPDSLKEP
jgi:outer membrane protein OmpA-like peptidoglycan-associated protein